MKLFGQIIDKLGLNSDDTDLSKPDNPARQKLDAGQWAKRAEDLDAALDHLTEALHLAESQKDQTSLVVITLHRAEAYIALDRFEEAENLLLQLRHTAQRNGQHTQLTYALITLGTLEQARDDWEEARSYYEQALKVAQAAHSLGGEGRALGHLADTYLQEDNASYAVHLLRQALPKLNLSGDIELSSHFVGQLGTSLIATGQEVEGERLLYRALRLAEQMKYRRYERHWALTLARRAMGGMRYEEARKLYEQALNLFSPSTNSATKIETLCEISRICLYLGDITAALTYAQQAVTEAAASPQQLTTAHGTLGMALRANGRSDEAITYLEPVATQIRESDRVGALQIEMMRNLAAARADTDDNEAAIALYHQVLDYVPDQPLELAQTHLELGILYEEQRQVEAAIKQWRAALTIYEGERYYAQAARLYVDIGGARRSLGQGKRAMKEFDDALMILSSVDDWATRGVVISNAAIAYADLGDSESAEAFFTEAIEIANRLGDTVAEATRRGNYGWFLLSTGRPQRAIVTLEQALRLSKQVDLKLQIAVQTDNLGLAHDIITDYHTALKYHQDAAALIGELNNPHWSSIIKINCANTHLKLNAVDAARPLIIQALAAGREQGDIEVIVRALIGKARLALLDADPQAADEMLDEALQLARQADLRRYLAEALQVQSEQQAALNETERSLTLWDEAHKLFSVLQMPQAELQPEWLKDHPVES